MWCVYLLDVIDVDVAGGLNKQRKLISFFGHYDIRVGLNDKVIVMDNNQIYRASYVRQQIKECEGTHEFIPPTSSYFNPIETVWAFVKAR